MIAPQQQIHRLASLIKEGKIKSLNAVFRRSGRDQNNVRARVDQRLPDFLPGRLVREAPDIVSANVFAHAFYRNGRRSSERRKLDKLSLRPEFRVRLIHAGHKAELIIDVRGERDPVNNRDLIRLRR